MASQQPLLVSIIVNNYNYAQFLPDAIDSALAQDYKPCEVIVVDDGSKDRSWEVIAGFGSRITAVLKENGGQSSALNAGFAASHGDVVIFLDADDMLEPQAARFAAEVFTRQPGLSRVQYRMAVIDAAGKPTGETKPPGHTPVPSGDIRRQMLTFPFDIAWLPTSGNAFSAKALRQVMPIPDEYGRINADYYLVHIVPLLGPVHLIDQVLASYRVHGGNNFEKAGATLDLNHLRITIQYDELTFRWIHQRALEAGLAQELDLPTRNYSVSTAASRLVSLKLDLSRHPIPGDRLVSVLALGLRAAARRFDTSPAARVIFAAWFAAMALAPRSMARGLAELFFFPQRRQVFNRLMHRLHNRGSSAFAKLGADRTTPSESYGAVPDRQTRKDTRP